MKKIIAYFSLVTFLSAPLAHAVETTAKQAILIDATTHAVMFEKAADEQMHPSSMSKLMTIYVLFDRLKQGRVKLDDKFTVSEKAWRTQGSKTFVAIGSDISVEDLIHGIITQSGNDACIVVAEALSGTEDAFAQEMNRIAKEIGLTNSNFVNSSGLPDPNHLMSARDLAILSDRLIEDFPEYYHYFAVREYTFNKIKQHNRNRLLDRNIGVDGLKTGHTEDGGYGIALSAKQGERRLILVINGTANDNARIEEGDRLMRYGFREFENKKILTKGQQVSEADVWFGKQATVPLVAENDSLLTLPITTQNNIKFTVKYNGPIPAPIAKDTHIADLVISVPGGEPQTVKLLAGADVEKLSGFSRMIAVIKHAVAGK